MFGVAEFVAHWGHQFPWFSLGGCLISHVIYSSHRMLQVSFRAMFLDPLKVGCSDIDWVHGGRRTNRCCFWKETSGALWIAPENASISTHRAPSLFASELHT